MRHVLLCLVITVLSIEANAQSSLWGTPQAYLGQTPPGNIPVKFAPQLINDSPFFSLGRCAFSADGREFYYNRNNSWNSGKDATIQSFRFDGSKWVGPTQVAAQIFTPTLSPDGNTMYNRAPGRKVTQMHRTAAGWGPVDTFLSRSFGLYDLMPTNSGNLYAASNVNGPANDYSFYDICLMKPLAFGDTTMHTLGRPLNTSGFDGDFFVAPDESYILISAKELPTYECEIFISYHKKDGGWTNPKSLGPEINTGLAHRWGEYVTPDGKYLIYSFGHSAADCALYWVRFDNLLENLRHTNFEPYVKDSIPAQTGAINSKFALKVWDNVFYDDDGNNTLCYTATLADGTALPTWLAFNAKTKTFKGKPLQAGEYKITVTATDNSNAAAHSTFTLKIE